MLFRSDRVRIIGELAHAAAGQVNCRDRRPQGQRVVRTEQHTDRVAAQHPDSQTGPVERGPGESDVDDTRAQAAGRVGEVSLPEPDGHPGGTPRIYKIAA